MVLNNLKYFYQGSLFNGNPKLPASLKITQKAISGTSLRTSIQSTISNCTLNGEIVVGTGTTPVTVDDHCLENKVTTVTQISANEVVSVVDGKVKKTFVRTLTYTGAETIRITEIGLEKGLHWETTTQTGADTYLLAREVLNNYIEIQPQETFTVSITIEL